MNENPINNNKSKRTVSIWMISIFYWAYALISGLVGAFNIIPLLTNNNSGQNSTIPLYLLFVIVGLGLALMLFLIGLGLWQLKRWARWVAIAISIIFVLINLGTFINSLLQSQFSFPVTAVTHALILIVLFSASVKVAFQDN